MNRKIAHLLLAFLTMTGPAIVQGTEQDRDALFHIERNKNANIVQYDAQLDQNGTLNSKQPVVAYWVRLAEQGQVKKLGWLQKRFAYGFTVKLNEDQNTATLDMAANLGRSITVKRDGEDYRAIANINGVTCYVDRLFIHARGKGVTTRVNYIEWYGNSVHNDEEQYERFSP